MPNWLLPENIADILPAEAARIEHLRRTILDRFACHGYQLVIPPLLEYLESLMAGTGQDMNLHTFKLVDQLSGRSMGVRADMTTQVARIDAHLLNRQGVTRLCYAGSVLHTRPFGLHATREPLQIGAEIYGYAGIQADAEIQQLALDALSSAGLQKLRIDLCHVGVVRAIFASDAAAHADQLELQALLRTKDIPALRACGQRYAPATAAALLALPGLYGEPDVLTRARAELPLLPGLLQALDELDALIKLSGNRARITIDLADLRGFQYESGAMFAIYVAGAANAVARGGRYDHVGEAFGRARPATGFSMDLRELERLSQAPSPRLAIRAPWGTQPALLDTIAALRAANQIVIQDFPDQPRLPDERDCDRELVEQNGNWSLRNLD